MQFLREKCASKPSVWARVGKKEGHQLRLHEFPRMPFAVEQDEPLDPLAIAILGPPAVVRRSHKTSDLIEEFGPGRGHVSCKSELMSIPQDIINRVERDFPKESGTVLARFLKL